MNFIGYACINMTLGAGSKKTRVTTNRSMIKRTFAEKGVRYASELALKNVIDLEKIIHWNEANGIKFFRVSSELFPWASEYSIDDMPDIEEIATTLKRAGDFAIANGHRITFHPGPFNKLCSPKPNVVSNTITDLEIHGKVFDLMGLSRTPYNKINIHVGASYGNKPQALEDFCRNFELLSDAVKTRITVENDDRPSLYSAKDLYEGVYKKIGIPIVFDYHHWKFRNDGESIKEGLEIAKSTWGDIVPVVHYSETKRNEDGTDYYKPQAHSDYVYEYIDSFGHKIDVMIEAKMKELALFQYKEKWGVK